MYSDSLTYMYQISSYTMTEQVFTRTTDGLCTYEYLHLVDKYLGQNLLDHLIKVMTANCCILNIFCIHNFHKIIFRQYVMISSVTDLLLWIEVVHCGAKYSRMLYVYVKLSCQGCWHKNLPTDHVLKLSYFCCPNFHLV
jgi:hypothetical protein